MCSSTPCAKKETIKISAAGRKGLLIVTGPRALVSCTCLVYLNRSQYLASSRCIIDME